MKTSYLGLSALKSLSLHTAQLSVSISFHQLQEEASLMRDEIWI